LGDAFLAEMRIKAKTSEDAERGGVRLEDLGGEEVAEVIGAMMSDLARLELEVIMLKVCADNSAIKFGGLLGLKSLQDCHGWMKENFDEN
jgi:hypothetical protein